MKKIILNISTLLFIALISLSCKDDYDYGQFSRDNKPAIPVTYQGATSYGFNPFITLDSSYAEPINITLEIPANSGRTIKEITRVVGITTAINAASVSIPYDAKTNPGGYREANIIASNIAGNGNTVTFTTSLPELRTKFKVSNGADHTLNGPLAKSPLPYGESALMFLLTLDNGDQIIPVQFRIRVTK